MEKLQKYNLSQHTLNEFYQMPKWLNYLDISSNTKIVYIMLLDRNKLSVKNNWVDDEKNIFFYFKQEELSRLIGISRKTISQSLKELEDLGLIETVRQSQQASRLYLLQPSESYILELYENYTNSKIIKFVCKSEKKSENVEKEKIKSSEPVENTMMGKNYTSCWVKKLHHDVTFLPISNTNINNTNNSNSPSFKEKKIEKKEGIKKYLIDKFKIKNTDFNYFRYINIIEILNDIYENSITIKNTTYNQSEIKEIIDKMIIDDMDKLLEKIEQAKNIRSIKKYMLVTLIDVIETRQITNNTKKLKKHKEIKDDRMTRQEKIDYIEKKLQQPFVLKFD